MLRLADSLAEIKGTRRTQEGYLIADAYVARTGIQIYDGHEVDPQNRNGMYDRVGVRVYRSIDAVKNPKSVQGFSHAPVTMNHPQSMVDASNWAALAIGEVSTEATWVGDKLRIPLIVKDAQAIRDIEAGKRELSPGYLSKIDWTPGVTEDGQPYDAQQTDISINHVAVVDRGRSGPSVRIGDAAYKRGHSWADARQESKHVEQMLFDGITIDVTPAAKQAITKLQSRLTDAEATVAAKERELGEKDTELEKEKKKRVSEEVLDAMVSDRAELLGKARSIIKDYDPKGKDAAAIRAEVVATKLGDAATKDRHAAYVEALFDGLVEDASGDKSGGRAADPVRTGMKDSAPGAITVWDAILKRDYNKSA